MERLRKYTINTELFEIYFSRDKTGKPNKKFKLVEQNKILEAINITEETIINAHSYSKLKPIGRIYRTPIIFEKVSKKIFEEKHKDHHAIIDYLPAGMVWNGTFKFKGVEIKTRTALISLCPQPVQEYFQTISHELIHAFYDSFLCTEGINNRNKEYFLEGIAEWLAQLTYLRYKKKIP